MTTKIKRLEWLKRFIPLKDVVWNDPWGYNYKNLRIGRGIRLDLVQPVS